MKATNFLYNCIAKAFVKISLS